MIRPVPRLARKSAVVCLALSAVLVVLFAVLASARAAAAEHPRSAAVAAIESGARGDERIRRKVASEPVKLRDAQGSLLAYPPAGNAKPLTVVYLHGIHGRAENGCPWLRDGATSLGWLVCPSANVRLENGTYSWGGSVLDQRAVVQRAEHAAVAAGADATSANVLVGFSQGAFVALDLVRSRLGSYRGLVLLAADVAPDAAVLARAGVSRVVLAAGELDASFAPLSRAAARLEAEGVAVRFVSLGKIGHTYQTPNKDALRDAIAWAGSS